MLVVHWEADVQAPFTVLLQVPPDAPEKGVTQTEPLQQSKDERQ
jgi:hypothetical protein